jgi:hypothetical protein
MDKGSCLPSDALRFGSDRNGGRANERSLLEAVRVDGQHRNRRMPHDLGGDAAEQVVFQPRAAVGPHDDQIRLFVASRLDDLFGRVSGHHPFFSLRSGVGDVEAELNQRFRISNARFRRQTYRLVQRESEDFPDGLREAYPSAYHPPPFSSKEKREIILEAFFWQHGQAMVSVPMATQRSVTVPFGHSNS